MWVCDLLVVVVVVPDLSASRLVAPNAISILAKPMEIGVRPNVQRHVMPLLWQCAGQISANPLETIRNCCILHIFACVCHAWSRSFRANTRPTTGLSECVCGDVIAVVIAIVVALLSDKATISIILIIIVNLCGIIGSVIGAIALHVWDWYRVNVGALDISLLSQPLQFLGDVAEHILRELGVVLHECTQEQFVEGGFSEVLLALTVGACLPTDKSKNAASWKFLSSVVSADEIAECLTPFLIKLKLRVRRS